MALHQTTFVFDVQFFVSSIYDSFYFDFDSFVASSYPLALRAGDLKRIFLRWAISTLHSFTRWQFNHGVYTVLECSSSLYGRKSGHGRNLFLILTILRYARIHRLGIRGLQTDDYLMILVGVRVPMIC